MTGAVKPAVFTPKREFMKQAIDEVMTHIEKVEGGPFGACVVHGNRIVAVTHNTVLRDSDATCHAEVNAIRMASKELKTFDLSGCAIYSTTEPCPMCFSAIHWARIPHLVYGTNIQDVQKLGFNELSISNQQMKNVGHSQVNITGDFLREECEKLLVKWASLVGAVPY